MPGFSNNVVYADNVDFSGSAHVQPKVTTDGQLLIGSTALPHIKVGSITSTGGTIAITPGSGTINIESGGGLATTYTENSGTATPALGNLNVQGGTSTGGAATNINTIGSGSTISVCLNNSISQPTTNAAGTEGMYSLGGSTFMHNYATGGLVNANTFLGVVAGNLTSTGIRNTGIGGNSLSSITSGALNTAVGQASGNVVSTGEKNTLIGAECAQALTTGVENVAVGQGALFGAVNSSASYNIALGVSALPAITDGQGSCIIGWHSGSVLTHCFNHIVLGQQSLQNQTQGANNIVVGTLAGNAYTTTESSNILIQNAGVVGESHVTRIGEQGSGDRQVNQCFIAGIAGVTTSNSNLVTIDTTTGQLGAKTIANLTTWKTITVNQAAVPGEGYFCNKAGTLALSLPATSAVGDIIEVANINTATGVQFTQAANQQIFIGSSNTTLGAGGTLTSSAVGDTLKIVCRTANLVWQVVSGWGNWTPA